MEIKYFSNPLDENEVQTTDAKTVLEAMQNLGIENKPLCVIINGECPDDFNIEYEIQEDDVIEIRNIVEGNANETWAFIVDVATVAAIVVMSASGFGAVALISVALAGALISGAIRKNAPMPKTKDLGFEDVAVATNDLSVTQAQNQVRKLQPIPIAMGDVQFAPDVYTYPYKQSPQTTDTIFIDIDNMTSQAQQSEIITAYSAQTFCYGIGDLDVYKRSIGAYEITEPNGEAVGYSYVNWPHTYDDGEEIPLSTPAWALFLSNPGIVYMPDVNPKAGSSFTNDKDNILIIPENDHAQNTWGYYEGQPGQKGFHFALTGNLYNFSGGAYGQLKTFVQVQMKASSETNWTGAGYFSYNTSFMIGDSPKTYYFTFYVYKDLAPGESLQIRIRKAQNDSVDNTSSKVARLSLTDVYFYSMEPNRFTARLALNIDGVYLTNMLSPDATTNNYVISVKAKCWVFRDSDWHWEHTRNPAWWFLFFAHGGFFNTQSKKNKNFFPYSPTNYWQNYPGHKTNEEIMFGGGYKNEEIDIERIKEWASFCDDSNLYIDMVLKDDGSVAEVLEKIANVGRGSVTYELGKLSVVYEDKEQIPVTMFGMANIESGSFSTNYNSSDLPSKIICSFANRDNNFETETVECLVPFSDQTKLKVFSLTLNGVTEKQQAQRECNLLAARQYFQTRSYSWKTDQEGFSAKRGDLVLLSHDANQYGFSGRIIRFLFDENDKIIGFKSTAKIEEVSWVMIRLPNSEMKKYKCYYQDEKIFFNDDFAIEDAPYQLKDKMRDSINKKSRFKDSIAEDYIFIADIKETVGKIVRIAGVEALENNYFTYSAVDEDPGLWSFEFDSNDPSSAVSAKDSSTTTIEITNASAIDNNDGNIDLIWECNDECLFMLIDVIKNKPIEIKGRFTIAEKKVSLSLPRNVNTIIRIVPISIYSKINTLTKELTIWPS